MYIKFPWQPAMAISWNGAVSLVLFLVVRISNGLNLEWGNFGNIGTFNTDHQKEFMCNWYKKIDFHFLGINNLVNSEWKVQVYLISL